MGMYTELILGCKLSKSAPKLLINALDAVINHWNEKDYGDASDEVKDFIIKYDLPYLFHGSSYCFGVSRSNSAFWFDNITGCWYISTRSNLKNYEDQIENFLAYLKPYVEQGSGEADIYAYVLYEECSKPQIYSLRLLDENS